MNGPRRTQPFTRATALATSAFLVAGTLALPGLVHAQVEDVVVVYVIAEHTVVVEVPPGFAAPECDWPCIPR